jgi:hypothetical protein
MLHYLRIAVTALSLTACVLLGALWARSYWWTDSLNLGSGWGLFSENGELSLQEIIIEKENKSRLVFLGIERPQLVYHPENYSFESGFTAPPYSLDVFVPHWFFVLLFAALAATPWLPWSKRFSLRTLLIATTLVAVGLGITISTS